VKKLVNSLEEEPRTRPSKQAWKSPTGIRIEANKPNSSGAAIIPRISETAATPNLYIPASIIDARESAFLLLILIAFNFLQVSTQKESH
jgi:hypothetical protein